MLRLLLLLLLASCQQSPQVTELLGVAMTIPWRILIGGPLTPNELGRAELKIAQVFAEVDRTYNDWNPKSEISRINQLPAHQETPLSPQLANLLATIDNIHTLSEGRFDPTLGNLCKRWKQDHALIITDRERHAVGWHHVHLTPSTLWKETSETTFDLGAIAKGHAVDLLTQALEDLGYHNLYVEWGGEIVVRGKHPANRPWSIGIASPTDPTIPEQTLSLTNCAIATSGHYRQSWERNGKREFHIINPATLEPYPTSSLASVTVIADSCAFADAIATILMTYPSREDAESWLSSTSLRDLTVHFVD